MKLRRSSPTALLTALLATALGNATMLMTTQGVARAAHVACGEVVTTSVTLDGNLGPCPGFGLRVQASDVTIDLNGYRIFGQNTVGVEQAGIQLRNVSRVTVMNGTVEGFDAGVAIEGGSRNTIKAMLVRDNINDLGGPCIYGDGITTFSSDENVIETSRVIHNGPYSGISLVDDSDNNVVRFNSVLDSDVPNRRPNGSVGPCGLAPSFAIQGVGIRVEGPGANGNRVEGNQVVNSAIMGIAIHPHLCRPPTGPPQSPNTNNLIIRNSVSATGARTISQEPLADGIAIHQLGPPAIACAGFDNTITENLSTNNRRDGISLGPTATGNTITRNVATNNARDGIRLAGPPTPAVRGAVNNTLIGNTGRGNRGLDGHDANPACDNNLWLRNRFGTVNQPCVANPSTGANPSASARASGATPGGGALELSRPESPSVPLARSTERMVTA